MRRSRSRALPVLAVTAALALAGCSFQGGVDEDASGPTPATSATTAPADPSPSATPSTAPTDDATAPSATSSPDASASAPSEVAPSGTDEPAAGGSGSSDGAASSGSGADAGSDGASGGAAPAPTATSDGADAGAGAGGGSASGDGSASGGSAGAAGGGSSSDGLQEIRFPAGQTSTTVRGQAPARQGPQYVFAASAGQEASVSITSDGDAVGFDLVAPDGTPLKTTMSSATSGSWTLPADGDYVVGLASADAGIPYALTLTIR